MPSYAAADAKHDNRSVRTVVVVISSALFPHSRNKTVVSSHLSFIHSGFTYIIANINMDNRLYLHTVPTPYVVMIPLW